MTNDELYNAEMAIELKLARYAQELYSELCLRVRVDQEDEVAPPNRLLENAINYLSVYGE